MYAAGLIVGFNGSMQSTARATPRPTARDGNRPSRRAVVRWLLLPVLLAVFALHVLTAEDAVVGVAPPTSASSTTVISSDVPVPIDADAAVADSVATVATVFDALASDGPGVLQDPWAAGCLLFLAALWVIAVLRRWIPVRAPLQASWWPGAVAGPPLWPVARLSLGVTRI
jgi:hypothetical protein